MFIPKSRSDYELFILVRRFQHKLRHSFHMGRLRKHINRLNIFDAIVFRQRLQVFRQCGRIAGYVDEAFRFYFFDGI